MMIFYLYYYYIFIFIILFNIKCNTYRMKIINYNKRQHQLHSKINNNNVKIKNNNDKDNNNNDKDNNNNDKDNNNDKINNNNDKDNNTNVKKKLLHNKKENKDIKVDNIEIDDKYIIKETTISSSSSSSSSTTITSSLSEQSQRRTKKNKYAEFSKKILDPIEETIINNKKKEEESKIDYSAPIRGTTVPTLGAASLKRKSPLKFENVSNIIPSDAYTFGYVKIGMISTPHGVKGEVKLIMETDFADERLKSGSVLYVKRPHRRSPRPIRVSSSRQQLGNVYLVSFDSVRTRIGATALKDFLVYIRQEDRPKLDVDEYLIRDLVGLDCYLANADNKNDIYGPIAKVDGVVPPDELCEGQSLAKLMHAMLELRKIDNEDELCLIPLVPQIVLTVDLEHKLLVIDNSYIGLFDYSYLEKKKIVIRGYLPSVSMYLTDKDRILLEKNSIFISKI